ncbi:MAG: hypothetical protein ACEQSA_05195 [Weeksellaceae bacterium]
MRTFDSNSTPKTTPVRSINSDKNTGPQAKIAPKQFMVMFVITLLLGIGAGFVVAQTQAGGTAQTTADAEKKGEQKESAGILDKETFSDTADGTLREGGIDGEGSFHLERTGGESQNVYLTSSTVDLSEFMGKKVTVWGQTFDSEKAGWLMDVGYIELKK